MVAELTTNLGVGRTSSHMCFTATAIVSLHYVAASGASAEIAVAGREGVVGISLFMGAEAMPDRAVVQSAGQGRRLPAAIIRSEFENSIPVKNLQLRRMQALMAQMSQT